MPARRPCLLWVRSCLCWGSHGGVGALLHGIKHHKGLRNAPPQPGGDGKLRGGGPSSAPCIFQPRGRLRGTAGPHTGPASTQQHPSGRGMRTRRPPSPRAASSRLLRAPPEAS